MSVPASRPPDPSPRRLPGQRAGLTRALVVDAGIAVIDENADALSLSEIARRLGVQVPALYSHVASLTELKQLMRVRLSQELGQVLHRAGRTRHEVAGLAAILGALRRYALAHPARWLALTYVPIGRDDPDFRASTDANRASLAGVVTSFGIPDDENEYWQLFVWSCVCGYIGFEVAHRDKGFTNRRFRRVVDDLAMLLRTNGRAGDTRTASRRTAGGTRD